GEGAPRNDILQGGIAEDGPPWSEAFALSSQKLPARPGRHTQEVQPLGECPNHLQAIGADGACRSQDGDSVHVMTNFSFPSNLLQAACSAGRRLTDRPAEHRVQTCLPQTAAIRPETNPNPPARAPTKVAVRRALAATSSGTSSSSRRSP